MYFYKELAYLVAVPDEIHDIFLLWFVRFRGFFEVFQPIQYLFFPELNCTVNSLLYRYIVLKLLYVLKIDPHLDH